MNNFIKKYYKWFILAALIFILGIIIKELSQNDLADFDAAIYNFIIQFKSSFMTNFFKFITFLASPIFLIILSILLFFIFKNKKFGLLSLVNLAFITLLNQVLKILFSRERPFDLMLIDESGYSFPSGHAMVSAAFYGVLIYLIWQTKIDKTYKKLLTLLLVLVIILIGISRIYLGVHYASDIIAGFAISVSYIIIMTALLNYYLKQKRKKA